LCEIAGNIVHELVKIAPPVSPDAHTRRQCFKWLFHMVEIYNFLNNNTETQDSTKSPVFYVFKRNPGYNEGFVELSQKIS